MNIRHIWPHLRVALRAMLVATLVLGIGYPLLVTGLAQLMPGRAHGSLVADADGTVVGSALIGQSFAGQEGYFQSRPSAVDDDAAGSGGSNLGPTNPELPHPQPGEPQDAGYSSGSGLDPDISPANARSQVATVAAARDLPEAEVADLVEATITGRDLGYLGEPTVNVLALNLALDALDPR